MATKQRQITRSAAEGLVNRVLDEYGRVSNKARIFSAKTGVAALLSAAFYSGVDSLSDITSATWYATVGAAIIAAGSCIISYIASLNEEEKRKESSDLGKYVRMKYGLNLVEDHAPGITYQ